MKGEFYTRRSRYFFFPCHPCTSVAVRISDDGCYEAEGDRGNVPLSPGGSGFCRAACLRWPAPLPRPRRTCPAGWRTQALPLGPAPCRGAPARRQALPQHVNKQKYRRRRDHPRHMLDGVCFLAFPLSRKERGVGSRGDELQEGHEGQVPPSYPAQADIHALDSNFRGSDDRRELSSMLFPFRIDALSCICLLTVGA